MSLRDEITKEAWATIIGDQDRDTDLVNGIFALVRAREGQLVTEVERLRGALRIISLCSQNSASSKEECGRIARQALQGEETTP